MKSWKAKKVIFRFIIRFFILAVAVLFALQILPRNLAVVLPAMSPFLAVCATVAKRSLSPLFLLCLPVLIISLLKGRWFCRNICPVGLIAEYAGKFHLGSKSKFTALPRLGLWIILLAFGSALLGYPIFLWLDPLSIFNGFISAWHMPITLASILPGTGLIIIVILNVCMSNSWCRRICPLGFLQELLGSFSAKRPALNKGRRMFLAAILGGAVGTLIYRATGRRICIRPPGATEENKFQALCARCGNCIKACPEKIIQPDCGQTGAAGFLTPIITIKPGYCSEWCNECCKVCPTYAIAHISLAEKRTVSIGTAVVSKSLCLAWDKQEYCLVCDEYCPYHAIKTIKHKGVNCPEVDPDICRGCGLCQTVCPAEKCAITVHGHTQRRLQPVEI